MHVLTGDSVTWHYERHSPGWWQGQRDVINTARRHRWQAAIKPPEGALVPA